MAFVDDLMASVREVAERVGPAVVLIGRDGRGAGVVVADGVVLTNAHNLRGAEATVTFAGGRREVGTLKGADPDGDLAVLAVETEGLTGPQWSEEAPGLGQVLFAVGRAGPGPRVTTGFVSATGQAFRGPNGHLVEEAFEHTAPLGRGSSGSPVVDAGGRLLGLNTHRLGQGFYLALPAGPELRQRVDALAQGESPNRLRLGVVLVPPAAAKRMRAAVGLEARDGLLVRAVDPDGPAARAGVTHGDLIVTAGGRPVASAGDLHAALRDHDPAAPLAVGLIRGTAAIDVEVTFATAP